MITIDHLLWAVPDLDEGMSLFEKLTGVRPVFGGTHPGRGTRNALVSFGPSQYLELIGPDPAQHAQASGADGFGTIIRNLSDVGLLTFSMRCDDMDALAKKAVNAGIEFSGPEAASRRLQDGSVLSWRLGFTQKTPFGRLAPFYIDWQNSIHPATTAPQGIELIEFEVRHPDAAQLETLYKTLGLNIKVRTGDRPGMQAVIRSASAEVVLSSC